MARIMLVQPWNYHDEGIKEHDLSHEWRNGPYSLLLLATQLMKHKHQVEVVDMTRDLVVVGGDVRTCLGKFSKKIQQFRPDIIGFGFFSIHYLETQEAVRVARQTCDKNGIRPMFIAGGIHASTEPKKTVEDLGFDYAFVGEAELAILRLADGENPESIPGIVSTRTLKYTKGEELENLDLLPFPDWSICDWRFYAYPSYGKVKIRAIRSLDMIMGRGCTYQCAFCAYNALSSVRFYSAGYLLEQMEYMADEFGLSGIYFTDSTIGNNRRLLQEFCEAMISRGAARDIEWYANMRPNQVNEELLKLMWRAGCRYLLYGFESGSQRVLNLMNKKSSADDNYKAAELHNKLRFPYNASMILGYPGEREEDILQTLEFLNKTKPPSVGINCYVPLPGSLDYERMKAEDKINIDDPMEWRKIGEVNPSRIYADVPAERFRELFAQAEYLANVDIPRVAYPAWGYKALEHDEPSSLIVPARPGPEAETKKWARPFEVLRRKWHEVPAADNRLTTQQLLGMPDIELLDLWLSIRSDASTGANYDVRGWYHTLYRDMLRGKRVMDVGSGLGIDGITFAQHGARMTFVDILESNLEVLKRLCRLLSLTDIDFCYLEDLNSLLELPADYDVIWCQGSLINAPFEIMRAEAQELLKHLPVGGRWIELAYPRIRWEREGKLSFDKWGEHTDGIGTPYIEWYDLEKLQSLLEPACFDVVLYLEFHHSDFNWFDLIRRA